MAMIEGELRTAPAIVDPQAGDRVRTAKGTRIVVARKGGAVMYQTRDDGPVCECWITTWKRWCRGAKSVASVPRQAETEGLSESDLTRPAE